MLEAASGVSGQPDDTAAAFATWSFLHGYATLEHAGAFGASGVLWRKAAQTSVASVYTFAKNALEHFSQYDVLS
jgi:hypothetical protein